MNKENPHFDGKTYDPKYDHDRLTKQLGRVWTILQGGSWLTLREISDLTKDPESSISARLRDLRKEKFGGYDIERRARGGRYKGIFEYKIKKP